MNAHEAATSRRNFIVGTAAGAAALAGVGFTRTAQADDLDDMIVQLVRVNMKPDMHEEAIETVKSLAEAVKQHEPGVLAYIPHQSSENADEIIFYEIYANEQALQEHGATDHMREARPKFGAYFDAATFTIERFDRLGGFLRG